MKCIAIVVAALIFPLLSGCVHKYAVPVPQSGANLIPKNSIVYVATPPNGRDDRPRTYEYSGGWTSSAMVQALSNRGIRAVVGAPAKSPSGALGAARVAKAQYMVFPGIVHWSDRATEWSGMPDRITLRVILTEVRSGEVLDNREIRASSRWATFGGDHPQELLPILSEQWAASICQ